MAKLRAARVGCPRAATAAGESWMRFADETRRLPAWRNWVRPAGQRWARPAGEVRSAD
jgi:hypothetical protein